VVKQQRSSQRQFVVVLAGIAVVGAAAIAYLVTRPQARPQARDVAVTPAQAEGYLLGNENAPVKILEFADFECPACGQFALLTEPDVRSRIVQSGIASYRFFDYPLPMHKNTMVAANAAACASDQGKFWEMHDKIFFNQPEWSGEQTSNPRKFMARYAGEIGLDVNAWNTCMDQERHRDRILGNQAEGNRRQVQATPTFFIGNKVIEGPISYDQFKALVDTAATQFASAATKRSDSSAAAGKK